MPAQTPPCQVSLLVQEFSSSHAAPSSSAALPTQVPFWQVSAAVQGLPSSQLVPVSGVTVQLAVPLQVSVLHWSEVQVMAVPTHCPLLVQVSLNEQALPSSHAAPVLGVTVQLAVPLHVRVLHVSEVHVMAVPTHSPLLEQVSLWVQALPSSHVAPVFGVTVQLAVPLQVRVLHVSEVHVTAVLWQTPASQVSTVQAFPSLQSTTVEQGVQPAIAVLWQTPASQVSVVQAFRSLQSAAVEQGVQPAMAVLWQTPASQESVVQAFRSLQSAEVEQGVQPAIGLLWQTPASQDSVVQAFRSSQSAAVEQSVQPAMAVPSHCPLPSQTSLKVQALPSSHGVLAGCKASGGQYTLVPVQVSSASHAPVAARQTMSALAAG